MTKESLSKKATFLARYHHQSRFRNLAMQAKEAWRAKGKEIKVGQPFERYDEVVMHLSSEDLSQAMYEYVMEHPEEMQEMSRWSSKRYRQRKKYEEAAAKVASGLSPMFNGESIQWVYIGDYRGLHSHAKSRIANRYMPVIREGRMEWEYVPEARK